MNKLKNLIYMLGLSFMIILPGCSDRDDELTDIDYDRLFSPTELTARVVNRTNVRLNWNANKKAESYNIEVFANGDSIFEGTPNRSIIDVTEMPYVIEGLEGETAYSIRVQAVKPNATSSKWTGVVIKTAAEQIFDPIKEDDLKATEVTLHWIPGAEVTELIVAPGNIKHTITADEKAAGSAIITGLTGETSYTVKLINGVKTRGELEFTTLVDLGGATAIKEGDDLIAILDAAEDGAAFVIMSGTFELGEYSLKKSLSLSGYKASAKPVVNGYFKLSGTLGSLNLKTLILNGADANGASLRSYLISADTNASIGDINVTSCEISGYKAGMIYDNSSGQFGNIKISDCIVSNIEGNGGDGFDFRGGKLTSLAVENTTFNTGFRAFVRVQVVSDVSFKNCTFYRVSNVDNSNNSGLFRSSGGGTLTVANCLFVETGANNAANISSGNWCKNTANMKATTSYSNNVYYNCYNLWVGLYTNPASCGAKEINPQFKDAGKGDFTIGNLDVTVGDPRWK